MRLTSKLVAAVALAMQLAFGALACAPSSSAGADDVTQKSGYVADMAKYSAIYQGSFVDLDSAYSVQVKVGDQTIVAPTHLFGEAVNVVPYANDDGVASAEGETFDRGDREIARVYKKGQVGIAVKHHRSQYPVLDLDTSDPSSMKEHFKLQDTHVEIVVGVERDGKAGAITVNSPQGYESGLFGDPVYAMMFLRPVYPDYLTEAQVRAFETNVRTMLIGFSAVADFPGEYNGGDPLGARTPDRVREHVKNMILSIAGDPTATAYFSDPANKIYCAELAHVAFSAGLIVPLNPANVVPLVGQDAWTKFTGFIDAHNRGESTPFLDRNANKRVALVQDLSTAPDDLRPAGEYGPAGETKKLAFEPMTASDIIEQFMRTHLPRETLGEQLAPLQGAVLAKMKPGLLEQMKLADLPPTDPARAAAEQLFDKIVKVVGTPHASYAAFRADVDPLLAAAQQLTGPRGDTGAGLFTPPSLYHVMAQGKHLGGLMRMQYEGHGIHVSAVKKSAAAPTHPTPAEQIPTEVSCRDRCGEQAPGGCFCDPACSEYGDCCADQTSLCPAQ